MYSEEKNKGVFSHHENCEKCGSSDGKAVYTSGSSFCFVCNKVGNVSNNNQKDTFKEQKEEKDTIISNKLLSGKYTDLVARKINIKTCKRFNYQVGVYKNENVHIANYFDKENTIVRQKIRTKNKDFKSLGDKESLMFGMNLCSNEGEDIIITEGEIDCMSISQLLNHKTPVISISNGVQFAKKEISKHLEFFNKYKNIILAFDNDEHGKKGISEVAQLFEAGKVKVVKFGEGFKDANDYVKEDKNSELLECIYNASQYRIDDIYNASELLERIKKGRIIQESYDLPFKELNTKLKGIKKRRITTITSGSGMGKTTIVREIVLKLLEQKLKIGYIPLEESVEECIDNLLSLKLNTIDTSLLNEEDYDDEFIKFTNENQIELYDNFGSVEIDNLLSKIDYMATTLNCDFVVLDHISMLVSGINDGDERRIIDNIMTKLRSLVQRTGVGLLLISHLSRPKTGTPHEEGGQTSLNQLRGSGGIGQISDVVIGIERNQQKDEEMFKSHFRILKSRIRGTLTGYAGYALYNEETGRIKDLQVKQEIEEIIEEEEIIEVDIKKEENKKREINIEEVKVEQKEIKEEVKVEEKEIELDIDEIPDF